MRLMVADDSKYQQKLLKRTLEKEGFEVVAEPNNGAQAVEMYAKYRPDFVTMDIIMPEMNGLEALAKILDFDRQARIIVVSALGHEAMVNKALKLGALGFVLKPVNLREFVKTIHSLS